MKLQNKLELYRLHANPELLYGYDILQSPGVIKKFNIEQLYLLIDTGLDFDFMVQKLAKDLGYSLNPLNPVADLVGVERQIDIYRRTIKEIIYEARDKLKYHLGGFDKSRLRKYTPSPDKRPLIAQVYDLISIGYRFDYLYQDLASLIGVDEDTLQDRHTEIENILLDAEGLLSSLNPDE